MKLEQVKQLLLEKKPKCFCVGNFGIDEKSKTHVYETHLKGLDVKFYVLDSVKELNTFESTMCSTMLLDYIESFKTF